MVRPIKELKGFQKVFIPKGQTKRVEFKLNVKDLGFWNNLMQYVVEPGAFEIMVGTNSEELQKKEAVWDDGKVSEAPSVKGRVVVQH